MREDYEIERSYTYIVWQSDRSEELLPVEGTLVLKECFVLKEQRYTQLARLHCRLEVNTILVQGAVRPRQYLEVVGQKFGGSRLLFTTKELQVNCVVRKYKHYLISLTFWLNVVSATTAAAAATFTTSTTSTSTSSSTSATGTAIALISMFIGACTSSLVFAAKRTSTPIWYSATWTLAIHGFYLPYIIVYKPYI